MFETILEEFKVKSGSLNNIDEVIEAFEMLEFAPDLIYSDEKLLAEYKMNSGDLNFKDEESELLFMEKVKSSGLAAHLCKELDLEEVPLTIAAMTIVFKSVEPAKEFYQVERKEDSKLKDFVYELTTREAKKRRDKFVKHRHNLKSENNKKHKKVRP